MKRNQLLCWWAQDYGPSWKAVLAFVVANVSPSVAYAPALPQ